MAFNDLGSRESDQPALGTPVLPRSQGSLVLVEFHARRVNLVHVMTVAKWCLELPARSM